MKIIQTENLTKYYGKARGIIDMNLSVEAGDIFGFIGPNGAGKSTTIRTLLGLISPTSGNARIFEQDILKNHIEILSRIGYMPSEAMFYHGMRVEDVACPLPFTAKTAWPKPIICVNASNWIQKRRLKNFLSGTEKKCPLSVPLCTSQTYIYWMSQPAGWTR